MKRIFDMLLASVGLLLLAIPLLLLVRKVRRELGSPVFFTQVRPGMHGKPFKMVKFRSMTSECGPDGQLLPDAVRLTPLAAGCAPPAWTSCQNCGMC
jgi:lipopolysaccharide/colanic/teichoic acid biosynthesis glycosyltransferase